MSRLVLYHFHDDRNSLRAPTQIPAAKKDLNELNEDKNLTLKFFFKIATQKNGNYYSEIMNARRRHEKVSDSGFD